ncbi:MAG: hypothetical protein JRJ84_17730 [Deltaproteobacteria bacterium]|nr:hypothetical protein [Deltaproteobacteria bacterium]
MRKHGKNIIGKQFASQRMADSMIDLFALACVLGRVSTAVQDRGATEAATEIEILRVFAGQALERARSNFEQIDHNDELVKSIAAHALEVERFSWDNL